MKSQIEQAKREVEQAFPFPQYMSAIDQAYMNIAGTVLRWLPKGAKILDFGSGPCDKTAIIQKLGYQCTAYDDLSDHWHRLPGHRERIEQFAKQSGVELHVVEDRTLPFEPESFDMVMTHAVLDHLHDSPKELMNRLVEFVKPEGLLFVTLPNAVNIRKRIAVLMGKTNMPSFSSYYWYPGSWRGHIREYVKGDLQLLAKFLRVETLELRGCHHMVKRVPAAIRPFYLLATAGFPGWRDSWTWVARKPKEWEPNLELPPDQLAKIINITAFQPAE